MMKVETLTLDMEWVEDSVIGARWGEDEEAAEKHGRKKKVSARRERR
jgi:hypothetical protein